MLDALPDSIRVVLTAHFLPRLAAMNAPETLSLTRQTWRNLAAVHWPVSDEVLRPLIAPELDLLLVDGKWWVTLAAFEVAEIEVAPSIPLPGLASFSQIELRTAVRDAQGRVGTWYLAVDATSATMAAAARAAFGLPYGSAAVTVKTEGVENPAITVTARRQSADPVSCSIALRATGLPTETAAGSVERALLFPEHAWVRGGEGIKRIDVRREVAPAARARIEQLEETWLWSVGIKRPTETPLAHFVSRLAVEIHAPAVENGR